MINPPPTAFYYLTLNTFLGATSSADIHIVVGRDAPKEEKYNWRNGDQPLFYWWQKNKDQVKGDINSINRMGYIYIMPYTGIAK